VILCGSPKEVTAQCRRIREEAGAGVLNLIFDGLPGTRERETGLELFARHCMPELRPL
jgi:hypothetical protein